MIHPLFVLSGFLVGALVGLTGVGGGSLMTPLLILLFGVHPTTAVGTDLLFAAATKTVGTAIHGRAKTVDWRIVGRLALGSVPATIMALAGLAYFGAGSHAVISVVSTVLGVALLVSAVMLIMKDRILAVVMRRNPDFGHTTSFWVTVCVGFALGFLVCLSSVGAGALGTVALILLYPRLPLVRIVGSDIAHAVPLTLLAGLGHWYLGVVDFAILGSLLMGSIPGIILGSYGARFAPDAVLKYGLSAVLALVGTKFVFS